jgi:hypothetical protein
MKIKFNMKKSITICLLTFFGFLNTYSQVLTKDAFGNLVKKDQYGNSIATFSKDAFGNVVQTDQNGNNVATYSVDAFGSTVKSDNYGNIISKFSKDAFGNTVETDEFGNIKATYSVNAFGKIIKNDQYGNVIQNQSNYDYGLNLNFTKAPQKFNDYIDPFDENKVSETLQYLDKNYSGRKVSQIERDRKSVNNMLYKYDEKLLNQSLSTKKNNDKKSTNLYKQLLKKQDENKLYDIDKLIDGWYEIISKSGDFYSTRYVEVYNHDVINWINGNNLKFSTTDLNKPKDVMYPYFLRLNLPDGKFEDEYLFFINNKPIKTPLSFEPVIFIFYTKQNIDGDMLYTRIFGNDFNQLQGTENNWSQKTNPKCNDKENIIKFYLPKGKTFKFHSNTRSKFWKGEITTTSDCQSLNLQG